MVFVQTVKLCLPEKANFFKKIDESTIFCQFPQSVRKITSLELFKILWNALVPDSADVCILDSIVWIPDYKD